MKTTITVGEKTYAINLSKPLDISIPLRASKRNVNAWYLDEPKLEKVLDVNRGDSVNFNTLTFNPHAHGTHTETVGHITKESYSINKCLKQFFFTAELISVAPEKYLKDYIFSKKQIQHLLKGKSADALVIRSMPNMLEKKSKQHSNTNWPYIKADAMEFIRKKGIKHLLIDQPSVDREKDGGQLLSHKAFWNVDGDIRKDSTITELIYVSNRIKDGSYLLNLQIAPFENDAAPSKPILYKIEEK